MAITEFSAALNQVATERGISKEQVMETIKSAIVAAYRKDNGEAPIEELDAVIDDSTGEIRITRNGKDVTPPGFGRIATQTAKQVILQKVRETEKRVIIDEFRQKAGNVVNTSVFRVDGGLVIVDLGRTQGVMPPSEQIRNENYRVGQRIKVLILRVQETAKGEEVVVSRKDPDFVVKLFEAEVPEISSNVVKIESIAREAGARTKLAVSSNDPHVDPVGSCVGQKGVRVQTIIRELGEEKIDIVPYSPDVSKYIAQSLSPATVTDVQLDEEEKKAIISVPEDQLSLAIGKEGQNVRLAAKLTGWSIDIKGTEGVVTPDDLDKKEDKTEEQVEDVKDETARKNEE